MLFANGYRYHMPSIGCPMSMTGYGTVSRHFGGFSGRQNRLNGLYRVGVPRARSSLVVERPRRRSSSNCNRVSDAFTCCGLIGIFRRKFSTETVSQINRRTNVIPTNSNSTNSRNENSVMSRYNVRKVILTFVMLALMGVFFKIIGHFYLQKSVFDSYNILLQLIFIISIICGIFMLVCCKSLFRMLFLKTKWNNSNQNDSNISAQPATQTNPSSPQQQSAHSETNVPNSSPVIHTPTPVTDTSTSVPNYDDSMTYWQSILHNYDPPPTYSQCSTRPPIETIVRHANPSHDDSSPRSSLSSVAASSRVSLDMTAAPPKYSTDPPPSYSQLDVRQLCLLTTPTHNSNGNHLYVGASPTPSLLSHCGCSYHHSNSSGCTHNQRESPYPVSWQQEQIQSPPSNQDANHNNGYYDNIDINTDHILYVEDYKTC